MQKRKILFTATACLALASSANALFPLFGGEVGISATAAYRYDSNINANSSDEGDSIFTIAPSIQWARKKGLIAIEMGMGFSYLLYADTGSDRTSVVATPITPFTPFGFAVVTQDGNDAINPNYYLRLSGPNGIASPLTYQLNFAFQRTTEANSLVGEITDTLNYDLVADVNYAVNDKYSIGISPSIQYQDYRTTGFGDVFSASLALDLQYAYSEKLNLDGGYRVRYQHVNSTGVRPVYESIDHTFFVGAFGVLLPKVTGNAQVGLTYRDWLSPTNIEENFVYPYVNVGLSWAYDEKTSFGFNAGVDLGQSPGNQGLETAMAGITASHSFTDQLSANAGFTYTHTFLTSAFNREDNSYYFDAGLSYMINRWASAGLTGGYQINDSDDPTFEYDRWNVGANLSVHF